MLTLQHGGVGLSLSGGGSPGVCVACHLATMLRGMEVRKMLLESRSCILPSSTEHPAPVVFCFQLVSLLAPTSGLFLFPFLSWS